MILLLALALAGEHDAPKPAAVAFTPRAIPEGAPRRVDVAVDQNVDEVIATLPAGSTVHLLPGDHPGPIHVDRPLTLEGPARVIGPGVGSVILVGAPDVTLRDLEITGSGIDATSGDAGVLVGADRFLFERLRVVHTFLGIDLRQADNGVIRGCEIIGREEGPIGTHGDGIRLWEADHNLITDNHLAHVRDLVVWYSNANQIIGNTVEHSRYGAHLMHTEDNEVRGNHYEHDVVGVFVMYSTNIALVDNIVVGADGAAGMGIGLKESDGLTLVGNRLLASTVGLYLDGSPHRPESFAKIEGNLIAYDHVGVRFHGVNHGAVFSDNELHENRIQVEVDGNVQATTVRFEGNRWSDYAGYDLDGDGLGDIPYAPQAFSRSIVDRRPAAAFFDGTPAAFLLDLLAAAFPMWAPPPTMTDAHPRMGTLGST